MMMTGSVLDILIYVFDQYMLGEAPEVPERDDLARHLEGKGFAASNVERALDWLAALACMRDLPQVVAAGAALRLFSECELMRLSTPARGLLLTLERCGVLSVPQREIVIERLLALDSDELDVEQLKWVVLMVLSSQPGQERAFARLEDLTAAIQPHAVH
jgi:Smg protein